MPIKAAKGERSPQRKDPTYREFVRSIGGRKGLREIALHSSNPKARRLLDLMDDSSFDRLGVKAIAHKADLNFTDIIKMRDERSRTLAISNLVAGLPALAEDLKRDAASKVEGCPVCQAQKFIPVPEQTDEEGNPVYRQCWKCLGKGFVMLPGDKDARQLIAKTTKLVEEAGTTVVTGDIHQTQINIGDSFEEQMKRAGKVIAAATNAVKSISSGSGGQGQVLPALQSPPDAVDAELVPAKASSD